MAKAIAAVTGQKLDMNQQCLSEGAGQLHRQLLPVHAGLGLADALGDQSAGGRADAVVGRRLGGRRRAHHAGVRALRALHPALGAGRAPDAHRGAHGEPARPALPRARLALRRGHRRRHRHRGVRHLDRVLRPDRRLHVVHARRAAHGTDAAHGVRRDARRAPSTSGGRTTRCCDRILIFGLEGEMYFGSGVEPGAAPRHDRGARPAGDAGRRAAPQARAQPRRGRHVAAREVRRPPAGARRARRPVRRAARDARPHAATAASIEKLERRTSSSSSRSSRPAPCSRSATPTSS